MENMIAFCGLACHECGAFLATKQNDDTKRAEVAQLWSKLYNADIKPEDVYCDGCLSSGGYLFNHCKVCEIRACGLDRGVESCAHCQDYACEKLEQFFKLVPEAQKQLDGIRGGL